MKFRVWGMGVVWLVGACVVQAQTVRTFVEDGSCKPDSLRYLWDGLTGPVTTNWTGMAPRKRHEVLVPESRRGGAVPRRIVMFGDLLGTWADTPPMVHPDVRAIFGRADLVIGNIEAPIISYTTVKSGLSPLSSQFYNYHVPRQFLRSITSQYCIDPTKTVFTVANNHANDRGDWPRTVESIQVLEATDGFRFTGVDADPSHDPLIKVFDAGDLRVGVVGWTHLDNTPPARDADGHVIRPTWQASRKVAYEWNAAADDVDTSRRRDFTARKRALGIDLLIGMPHWGCEFQSYPKPYQVSEASQLARSGFDVIAGAHPGVMQPASLIDGQANKLAFYSLGVVNKLFNLFDVPSLVTAVELLVDDDGRLLEYTVHPFIQARHKAATAVPTQVACPDGRVAGDMAGRLTRDEVITLDLAYRLADTTGEWKRSQVDAAVRAFNEVFPP